MQSGPQENIGPTQLHYLANLGLNLHSRPENSDKLLSGTDLGLTLNALAYWQIYVNRCSIQVMLKKYIHFGPVGLGWA